MVLPTRVSTLGQRLRQAGDMQDLVIRQVPTRLDHSDDRSITPTSLPVLAYDSRRPSCNLDRVFTWASPVDGLLRAYLQCCPKAAMACIAMRRQTAPYG